MKGQVILRDGDLEVAHRREDSEHRFEVSIGSSFNELYWEFSAKEFASDPQLFAEVATLLRGRGLGSLPDFMTSLAATSSAELAEDVSQSRSFMHSVVRRATLVEFLQDALARRLPAGWLHLAERSPNRSTDCLFVPASVDMPEGYPAEEGFPFEGLETGDLESVSDWAKQLTSQPSSDQLVQAFVYYWKFDAFPASFGAGDPPSPQAVMDALDRQFFQSLGEERSSPKCRREGCSRGAIPLSVFCRAHHFESVKGRPYRLEGV